MRPGDCITCKAFPCADVKHESCMVPAINLKPESVSIVMISECAPADPADYFYAKGKPAYAESTAAMFRAAGCEAASMKDIVAQGVYVTTAVKCAKTGAAIQSGTIEECSHLLEKELALFPRAKVLMLMGDVAIRALNSIAKRTEQKRALPALPTYKMRGQQHYWKGMRVLPSYLQVGPSILIEKGKQNVFAEDIATALKVARA